MVAHSVTSPISIQSMMKAKIAEDGKVTTTDRRLLMENGHPGVEVDEAAIRRGENPYTKYYQQQGENPLPSGTQVRTFYDFVGSLIDEYYSHNLFATSRHDVQKLGHITILKEILQSSLSFTAQESPDVGTRELTVMGGTVDHHVHVELLWPSLMYHTVHVICDFPDNRRKGL